MGTLRYLNVMLTVIAVLLSLQLWTQWTMSPSVITEVHAGNTSRAQPFPNAAKQRKDMKDSLDKAVRQLQDLNKQFQSGKARVHVENISETKER